MAPIVLFLMFIHHSFAFLDAIFDSKKEESVSDDSETLEASPTAPSPEQIARINQNREELAKVRARIVERQKRLDLLINPPILSKTQKR